VRTETDQDAKTSSLEARVNSLWVVAGMAIGAGSLRFAMRAATWVTLWYLYGWATIKHDHLRVLNVKPFTVSNGDVLRGIGPYHYFVSVAIWLPLALGIVFLLDRWILPEKSRRIVEQKQSSRGNYEALVLLYVLPMVFLVTAFLPTEVALLTALVSAAVPIIWIRHICSDNTIR